MDRDMVDNYSAFIQKWDH